MVDHNARTDIDKRIFCDTEFDDLAARLHLGFGKVPPHGLADTLGLCGPGAELQCGISVAINCALINNIAAVEFEYCDWNMIARVIKDAGHSQFLSYDAGSHLGLLQLDFYVDAGRKIELHKRVYGLRGRVDDIEQTFVGADFKLFTRLLVHMR